MLLKHASKGAFHYMAFCAHLLFQNFKFKIFFLRFLGPRTIITYNSFFKLGETSKRTITELSFICTQFT